MSTITEALRAARACIQQDRTSLADNGMRPDNTMEPDAAAGVADYDAVLQQIDAALVSLSTSAAQAGWQPIETAPQGAFLVYLPDARVNKVQAARRHNGLFVIGNQFAFDLHEKPSHWMHEPHAPIKKEQEA